MEMILLPLIVILCLGVRTSSADILQRQKRNWIIDSFKIEESYQGPFPYSLGKIKVENELTLFKIEGQGANKEPKGVVQINQFTGEITVHRAVDYESYQILNLVFQAYDREKNIMETRLGVEIQIIDSNDNPPKFDYERHEITIKESLVQGTGLITLRVTDDDATKMYRTSDLRIVSVTPKGKEIEFYVEQMDGAEFGIISFRGCLDHESEEKYTIVVEAKNRAGELSSSCTVIINIEDGNNHLPEITGQTGPGRVKEGKESVVVTRLQVTDEDTKGTKAWKAKYTIHGDLNNYFGITTDPETNEGLLSVVKALDYEESQFKNVTISVENEIPFSLCKVVNRRANALWEVVTTGDASSHTVTGKEKTSLSTKQITVIVEDVNDSPVFDISNKQVVLTENAEVGQYLETFTASDPDINSAIVYIKGDDPANWVTVDSVTGRITTSKVIDRESTFVQGNIYNVTIYAVDNGQPPATATATLNIHISDENDNAPTLTRTTMDMCQSDGPSRVPISAVDLDEEPYGGPFSFKVLGDVEGKWRVDPRQGHSVDLVKENTVYSGSYKLLLEVSDLQGTVAMQNLSVTVCNCLDTENQNCSFRKATALGAGGLAIILLSVLLLAAILLSVFLVSCKKIYREIPNQESDQCQMKSNTETPGSDCQLYLEGLNQGQTQKISKAPAKIVTSQNATSAGWSQFYQEASEKYRDLQKVNSMQLMVSESSQGRYKRSSFRGEGFTRRNSLGWSSSSARRTNGMWMGSGKYSAEYVHGLSRETLLMVLNKALSHLQAPGEELGDYAPHVYADEREADSSGELDAIVIAEVPFDINSVVDSRLSTLASVCMANVSLSDQASS